MAGWRLDDVITREHILRMVRRQRELNFEPGAEHLYCNTGYTLLAEVVARVSGQTFPQFTEERIFRPLGMSHTHFHDDHEHIVPGRAYSYAPAPGGGFKNSVLSFANAGATSLFTTVEDLARWLVNLDRGTVGGGSAIAQMHERGKLNDGSEIPYAFALVHGTHRGLATVSHGGSDAGFRSFAVRFPEQQLGVVVLSNLASFDPGGLALRVADVVLAPQLGPAETKAELARVELLPEVLDRHAGLYRLDIGSLVTVRRLGRRLLAGVPGLPEVEMVPLSEREFAIEEVGARVRFDEPLEQRSPGFDTEMQGQHFRAVRVEPLDSGQLADLAGEYWSPELETRYVLVLEGGQLVARHQRNDEVALVALGSDQLAGNQWWFGSLRFERDAAGAVSGFRLSGMRVRNLAFIRGAVPSFAAP